MKPVHNLFNISLSTKQRLLEKRDNLNCDTDTASLTATLYIGETKRKRKTRFSEHLRYARQRDDRCITGQHFGQDDHSPEDMTIQILEKVRIKDKYHLQQREDFWINFMRTRQSPGLNTNLQQILRRLDIVQNIFVSHVSHFYKIVSQQSSPVRVF